MKHEHDEPNYANDPDGKVIPMDAHIRLANPRTPESQSNLMLRRGYSYSLGVSNAGQLEMGLLFCYQADLEKGFLTVQKAQRRSAGRIHQADRRRVFLRIAGCERGRRLFGQRLAQSLSAQ